ncbi:hypothetical protein EsH8_VII_000167 [Colletotrichum jinshuiense]
MSYPIDNSLQLIGSFADEMSFGSQRHEEPPNSLFEPANNGTISVGSSVQLQSVALPVDRQNSIGDADWQWPTGVVGNNNTITTEELSAAIQSSWETDIAPTFFVENNDFAGETAPHPQGPDSWPRDTAAGSAIGNTAAGPKLADTEANAIPAKIGSRFSKQSVRILKQWLNTHSDYPYPSHADKQSLQLLTGLSMNQIINWLGNARRRQKAAGSRALPTTMASERPGTPIPRCRANIQDEMDPFQRWVDSPPEDEPATVDDIERAISSRGAVFQRNSRDRVLLNNSSGPSSILDDSSASSVGSSRDGSRSGASASSQGSARSRATPSPLFNQRRRKRGRQKAQKTPLCPIRRQYQCTFCTETFRAKYDWQRHEKSLHIPLERWMCAPNGPTSVNPVTNQVCCVFCDEIEPDAGHIAQHNFDACQERVFNRKDHLKQHLHLVHNSKGVDWVLRGWKDSSPEVKSRCGFCGITLQTWAERTDHLTDHFKTGHTMADWKGDWGFDESVLETLESFIPPYLIDHERTTPFPFNASVIPPNSPRTAYELITLELAFFTQRHLDRTGETPNNSELQLEACRIIFASEVASRTGHTLEVDSASWLRDLIISDEAITRSSKFGPIRTQAESRLSSLQINGKRTLFESCPLELQLQDYVHNNWLSSFSISTDNDLQMEACRIIARMEQVLASNSLSEFIANWLAKLATASADWLAGFKDRARIPSEPHMTQEFDLSLPEPSENVNDLSAFAAQHQNESDIPWTHPQDQMQATDPEMFSQQDQGLFDISSLYPNNFDPSQPGSTINLQTDSTLPTTSSSSITSPIGTEPSGMYALKQKAANGSCQPAWMRSGQFILNDSNSHRWLSLELKRWASATMSPNNPNWHFPTDEEIRHQARCLLFDE